MINIVPLRTGLLGVVLLFSLITLALAASLIAEVVSGDIIPTSFGLDLGVAVITIVIVAPAIAIDFFRKGAVTSMVLVELSWVFVLKILWVAASGETTAEGCIAFFDDGFDDDFAEDVTCGPRIQALRALSWLNFLILLGWFITLIVLALTSQRRGNPKVWTSSVTGTDFHAQHQTGVLPQQQMPYQQTPMQEQQTGYSQGYPPVAGTGEYNTPPPVQQYGGQQYHSGAAQV